MMAQVLKLLAVHRQLTGVKEIHAEIDERNEEQKVQWFHQM